MSDVSDGWEIRESGPSDAEHAVLMLPGALCSAAFYGPVAEDPLLADIRCVATTLPGYCGTPPLSEPTIEALAVGAARVAEQHGCDVVVGHSVGANVALEMAASGSFSGPVVLLSPSLSRTDESRIPRTLDRLATVLGHLPYRAVVAIIGPAFGGGFPESRRAELVADMRRNDPRVLRRLTRAYLGYLDRYGSVADRLCDAGVPSWLVYGENDDAGITDAERSTVQRCATVVTVPGASHFTLLDAPGEVAALIIDATEAVAFP